jgi:hypothetical protein
VSELPPWALATLAAVAAGGLGAVRVRLRIHGALARGAEKLWVELLPPLGLGRRRWRLLPPRRSPGGSRGGPGGRRPLVGKAFWLLRGQLRLERLALELELGTGDAARTALAVGSVYAVVGSGLALLPLYFQLRGLRPAIRVVPQFGQAAVRLQFDCILAARLGHLMLAAARILWARWREGVGARRSAGSSA